MTPWGLLIVVLLAATILTDPRRFMPWLLSLTLALPKTAALIAGPFPLGGFQLVSVACAPLLLHHLATRGVPPAMRQPSTWVLFGLLGWAASVTALSPTLFYGTTIYTSQVENSEGLVVEAPLTYTSSNLAQVGYLGLLIVVVLYLCTLPRLDPRVLLLGLGTGMFLSSWRLAGDRLGVPFPTELIDRSTYLYVDLTGDGTYRLRGVFTEPSVLALYALAALALCLVLALAQRGASVSSRWLATGIALLAIVNLVFSRSGTGVVAGGLLIALAVPTLLGAGGRSRAIGPIAVGLCGAVALALVMHQQVLDYAGGIVSSKVGSSSYNARTQSDLEALTGIGDTFGLGVGLGSTRSSSLWPYLVASIGPIGAALFAAVVVLAVLSAWRDPAWHGAGAVLVATVVTKSIAGSAPFEPLLVLAIAVCLAGPRVGTVRPTTPDGLPPDGFGSFPRDARLDLDGRDRSILA
jgi:hypothetical protein